jgi:uncharacterized protein GlcG (DUF336 family)
VWSKLASALALGTLLAGCSGGGGGATACVGDCSPAPVLLTEADVQRIVAQAVGEAQARGAKAHVVVVDRVGNVLAAFRMTGAPETIAISSGLGVTGGLDGIPAGTVPAALAAIAKAVTGAYLSSAGNAFTTRTAGQIIQEHFDPGENDQPSGPLYGVQFSQLSCSDVNRNLAHGSIGPKRSPLGLAADPGGLPLYKAGVVVGGIGIEANGMYGIDRDITGRDEDDEELIAVAGSAGFAAPEDIRASRITADGRTFRFVDSEALRSNPAQAPAWGSLAGSLAAVDGYAAAAIRPGVAFGTPASGIRPGDSTDGWILVDGANANRFAPRASADGSLTSSQVAALLGEALAIAKRARAQIRRPLGSSAEVTIAVVDLEGDILGLVRTPDAPVFGIDVSVQKARTAMFFSHPLAGAQLAAAPPAVYVVPPGTISPIGVYAEALTGFVGSAAALSGAIAWTPRAIGNLHRPGYPDGIAGTPAGPLSKTFASWSPFNVGLQLDLAFNQIVKGAFGDVSEGCAGRLPAGTMGPALDVGIRALRNGAQVFPGGVPIYRGTHLVGAIGVSGDGVDQDDMIAYLGVANAARALGAGFGHAPPEMRADTLVPQGVRLRYVQCPQSPFNGSTEQNACQ